MGRPKKGAKKVETPSDERVAVIVLKGSPQYAEWLDEIHRKTYIPKASIVRLALARWAESNGHPSPPEL